MSDIELVIKINEEDYEIMKHNVAIDNPLCPISQKEMVIKIVNGTPLPKGHGDLIDRKLALSDDGLCEFHMYADYVKMRNYLKSIPRILGADMEGSED